LFGSVGSDAADTMGLLIGSSENMRGG